MVFGPGPPRPARTSIANSSRNVVWVTRAVVRLTSVSQAGGAEAGVDVRVMGLEPVPEGAPQHAGRRPRRAALLDVVLAVEEVLGVALVVGMRRKSRERAEHARRPLPSVAHQLGYPEGAVARGE